MVDWMFFVFVHILFVFLMYMPLPQPWSLMRHTYLENLARSTNRISVQLPKM